MKESPNGNMSNIITIYMFCLQSFYVIFIIATLASSLITSERPFLFVLQNSRPFDTYTLLWTRVAAANVKTVTNVTMDNKCNKSTTNITKFRLATYVTKCNTDSNKCNYVYSWDFSAFWISLKCYSKLVLYRWFSAAGICLRFFRYFQLHNIKGVLIEQKGGIILSLTVGV